MLNSQFPILIRWECRIEHWSDHGDPRPTMGGCATLIGFWTLPGRLLVPRTKMTRHQLKEQDEITTSLQKFTEFAVSRQKELIAGVVGVAVLAIAFFAWSYYSSRRNANAQTMLSQAINIYNDTTNIKSDKERY